MKHLLLKKLKFYQVCFICFLFTRLSAQTIDSTAINYNKSQWHVEYRIGVTNNFLSKKTQLYFNNYINVSLSTSFFFRNFIFTYSFNPTTILGIKKKLNNTTDSIVPYSNTFWKSNGPYSINIMKHNIDFGNEFLFKNYSLTPTAGLALWHFSVKDSANYKKNIKGFYDLNFGLACRKYLFVSNGSRFFYGLQGYLGYTNAGEKFSGLGNYQWTLSINCGFKFVPQGLIALGILSGLSKSN